MSAPVCCNFGLCTKRARPHSDYCSLDHELAGLKERLRQGREAAVPMCEERQEALSCRIEELEYNRNFHLRSLKGED